jgi:hypothetical protein
MARALRPLRSAKASWVYPEARRCFLSSSENADSARTATLENRQRAERRGSVVTAAEITLPKLEPSAHVPWQNTMLGLVCVDESILNLLGVNDV